MAVHRSVPDREEALPPRLAGDPRAVLTLDAGGTNFVFSALRGGRDVATAVTLPSQAHQRAACLEVLLSGFTRMREQCGGAPAAISFAFPGPADYPAGIVGNAHNLPAFRDPLPLGPLLEDHFGVPVFINNDGNLFAYGEAIAGFLPWLNALLAAAGSRRRYHNLVGATLGTGFGAGIVHGGRLFMGDNGAAGEIWALRHKLAPEHCVEDGASIRAVREEYARLAGLDLAAVPAPQVLYEVAQGRRPGDRAAAREAFRRLGEVVGDAIACTMTLLDGAVVLGGGLAGAAELFLPAALAELNGPIRCAGGEHARTHLSAFDLDEAADRERFLAEEPVELEVPGTSRRVPYDPVKRLPIGLSRLGTSRAVAIGAYAIALDGLDGRTQA